MLLVVIPVSLCKKCLVLVDYERARVCEPFDGTAIPTIWHVVRTLTSATGLFQRHLE